MAALTVNALIHWTMYDDLYGTTVINYFHSCMDFTFQQPVISKGEQ